MRDADGGRHGVVRHVVLVIWAPLLVLITHVVLDAGLHAYATRPWLDGPMHVCGGLAVGYAVARGLALLGERAAPDRVRLALEWTVIVTATGTVAILWEFAEFAVDQAFGTNLQVSLPNTMKDLAMGLSGALLLVIVWRPGRGPSPRV